MTIYESNKEAMISNQRQNIRFELKTKFSCGLCEYFLAPLEALCILMLLKPDNFHFLSPALFGHETTSMGN